MDESNTFMEMLTNPATSMELKNLILWSFDNIARDMGPQRDSLVRDNLLDNMLLVRFQIDAQILFVIVFIITDVGVSR